MPVGGHSKTVQCQRGLPRPGLTLTVFHHPSSDVQSHVEPLRRRKGCRLVCRAQQQTAVGTRLGRGGAVLWELAPGRRPNWSRLKSLAQGMPIVSYSADLAAAVAQRSRRFGFTSHLSAPLNPLEVVHQIAVAAPAAHVFLSPEGHNCRLTASAGVATLPDIVPSSERLIQAADDAMYWVKAHKDGVQLAKAVA